MVDLGVKMTPDGTGINEWLHGLEGQFLTPDCSDGLTAFLADKQKVALVTSGGTMTPLEAKCVRYIENFSTGTRGAISAEYFLKNGYSVIFLYRKHSVVPFIWRLFRNGSTDISALAMTSKLDQMDLLKSTQDEEDSKKFIGKFTRLRGDYQKHTKNFLAISYEQVEDYLVKLRHISIVLNKKAKNFKRPVIFYLAAAISDYFLPQDSIFENKIPSGIRDFSLKLTTVPKIIPFITRAWFVSQNIFLVTFKLETDETILLQKAQASLVKNNCNLVIANILSERYKLVHFVKRSDPKVIKVTTQGEEIEEKIISKIIELSDAE